MTYAVPHGTTIAEWVRSLIADEGTPHKFYLSMPWRRKRAEIIERAHGECHDCLGKSPAVYTRATCVHHDQHLDSRPDLALADTWTDGDGVVHSQLVPLCDDCHDARHDRFGGRGACTSFSNPERW